MTRSIRGARRATVLVLGGTAAVSSLLLSGCGAGQIAETAAIAPAVSGVNAQSADNLFKIRNLAVTYNGVEGYAAGANAPLDVVLYNDSAEAVTVTVATDAGRDVVLAGPAVAPSVTAEAPSSPPAAPTETATPGGTETPGGSNAPSTGASAPAMETPTPTPTPAGVPASIEIKAHDFAVLTGTSGRQLQVNGLNNTLRPGMLINLNFAFGSTTIKTSAPVALPLTAAPRATPVVTPEG